MRRIRSQETRRRRTRRSHGMDESSDRLSEYEDRGSGRFVLPSSVRQADAVVGDNLRGLNKDMALLAERELDYPFSTQVFRRQHHAFISDD